MKKNNKLALAIALVAGLGGAGVMEATQPQQTETTQQATNKQDKQRTSFRQQSIPITNQRRTVLGNVVPKSRTKRTSFLGDGGKKKHNNLIRTNRSKKRLRTKNNA